MSKCSFCRNEPAENEHKFDNNPQYKFYMCDDCDKHYKEHKQLGPKFVFCCCDPEHPKELDIEMAKEEIAQNKPKIVQDRSGLNKDKAFEVIHETSGYISKDENDNKFKARQEEYKNSRRRKK